MRNANISHLKLSQLYHTDIGILYTETSQQNEIYFNYLTQNKYSGIC